MEKSTNNQVQKQYTPEEQKTIDDAIISLSTLFDLGISLTKIQRQENTSVAKERMPYIRLGLKAVKNYPEVLPRDFNEAGYEDDVILTEYLHDVLLKLGDLKKKIEDIFIVAGSESLVTTKQIRKYLKAKHDIDPKYGNILAEMDAFFKKSKNKVEKPETKEENQETIE